MNSMFEKYSSIQLFYDRYQGEINSILNAIEDLNLRTIQYVIEIVQDVYSILEKNNLSEDENNIGKIDNLEELMDIFTFALVLSTSYKNGEITSVLRAKKHLNYSPFIEGKKENKGAKSLIQNNVFISKRFRFYTSVADFIFEGYINESTFLCEIKEKYKKEDEKLKALRILRNYDSHELEDLNLSFLKVMHNIDFGNYDPKSYIQTFKLIKFLIDKNILKCDDNLLERFKKGLEVSLNQNVELLIREETTLDQQLLSNDQEHEVQQLIIILNERTDLAKKEIKRNQIEDIVKRMNDSKGIEKMAREIENFTFEGDFFKYLCEINFWDQIVCFPNKKISQLNSYLRHLYLSVTNSGDYNEKDAPHMRLYCCNLKKKIKSTAIDPLKAVILEEHLSEVQKVINHVR
ncbi:hypothetical protein [Alkalicoccus saliphilus]|uniref:Uncharacterized protein n=1 Tax=Alkalicoccus saliphilus TaxID=200989 RepID=A0A2T4U203_9BACI|nr:hypothetical protein [Alkalicoccus saliphilus]PTL37414.1 hypothetical protein C6Y45_16670 [Alkalicoccus saliphilus]